MSLLIPLLLLLLLFPTGTGMETSVKSFSWLMVIAVWSFTVSLLPMLSWLEMLPESLRCFSCKPKLRARSVSHFENEVHFGEMQQLT